VDGGVVGAAEDGEVVGGSSLLDGRRGWAQSQPSASSVWSRSLCALYGSCLSTSHRSPSLVKLFALQGGDAGERQTGAVAKTT
jgi:hypothetical protein